MKNVKPLSSKELIKAKGNAVFQFLLFQFFFAFLIAAIFYVTSGYLAAYSFFLGTLMGIIPSFYMAFKVFYGSKVKTAQDILKSFYKGETGKLIIAAILLSLVFIFVKPLATGIFFIGYGVIILSHWLSPVVIKY